ncbi:MAG: ABC transporter substrate-binding protein, partial [Rhodobacteraceae bacterium]|nr:ABC transporter substrate-binding protein [Paracoccaceae bacterium]
MRLPVLFAMLLASAFPLRAETWDEIVSAARGQTVYWNAWGGDERTNDFIRWASERLEADYGVTIQQVKLTDTAEAVTRV